MFCFCLHSCHWPIASQLLMTSLHFQIKLTTLQTLNDKQYQKLYHGQKETIHPPNSPALLSWFILNYEKIELFIVGVSMSSTKIQNSLGMMAGLHQINSSGNSTMANTISHIWAMLMSLVMVLQLPEALLNLDRAYQHRTNKK